MRSEPFSFVPLDEDEFDTKKSYCRKCEETTKQFNKLVPRFIKGIRDDKFKICSYCGEMYPIFDVKFFTEYEPKGYIADNPFDTGAKIVAQSKKRKIRTQHRINPLPNEDIEIPKFAGKKDEFLEHKVQVEGAVINRIVDSGNDE